MQGHEGLVYAVKVKRNNLKSAKKRALYSDILKFLQYMYATRSKQRRIQAKLFTFKSDVRLSLWLLTLSLNQKTPILVTLAVIRFCQPLGTLYQH